jgi:hypothetical protein
MALPELNAEQKYNIREIQLKIAQASIDINNIRTKADQDVRIANQSQTQDTIRLRSYIENIAKENDLDFTKATFDLDTLKFNEIPVPATVGEIPAQAKPTV